MLDEKRCREYVEVRFSGYHWSLSLLTSVLKFSLEISSAAELGEYHDEGDKPTPEDIDDFAALLHIWL